MVYCRNPACPCHKFRIGDLASLTDYDGQVHQCKLVYDIYHREHYGQVRPMIIIETTANGALYYREADAYNVVKCADTDGKD